MNLGVVSSLGLHPIAMRMLPNHFLLLQAFSVTQRRSKPPVCLPERFGLDTGTGHVHGESPLISAAGLSVRLMCRMCTLQGAYRDDDCKPVVLNVVREAESRIAGSNFMEYLPIGGMKAFSDLSVKLAFGEDAAPIQEGRVAAVQSLSGTGETFSVRYLRTAVHACAVQASTQQRRESLR